MALPQTIKQLLCHHARYQSHLTLTHPLHTHTHTTSLRSSLACSWEGRKRELTQQVPPTSLNLEGEMTGRLEAGGK